MGNITPCLPNNLYDPAVNLFEISSLFLCDVWAVPHIVAPFLLTIITRDPFLAFAFAGIAEIGEALANVIFGDFGIFLADNEVGENISGILIEDWLIQGGIGVILGMLYMLLYQTPRFLRWQDLYPKRRIGRFVYYGFFFIFLVGPAIAYALESNGFKYGILIYIGAQFLFTFIHLGIQRCKGKPMYAAFWLEAIVLCTILNVQNMFDYLFSNAVQSWLWSEIIAVYLLLRIFFSTSRNRLYIYGTRSRDFSKRYAKVRDR